MTEYNKEYYSQNKEQLTENNKQYKSSFVNYDNYNDRINYAEQTRQSPGNIQILEVKCAYCGNWYKPTISQIHLRISSLEGRIIGEHRLYCSDQCKQECPIFKRILYPKGFKQATSREVQAELRQLVLKRDNYQCQKCEKHQVELDVGLHCHHLTGVEINPIESADIDNCITLCKKCHKEVHKLPGCSYYDYRRKKCKTKEIK